MPHALELPGALRAVIPLVRGERFPCFRGRVVHELVALALGRAVGSRGRLAGRCSRLVPCLAAIIGALDDLPEPAAGLRRVNPIRIDWRSLEMVHLPARKEQAADIPVFAFSIRRQDECTLACSNQYPYLTHSFLLPPTASCCM